MGDSTNSPDGVDPQMMQLMQQGGGQGGPMAGNPMGGQMPQGQGPQAQGGKPGAQPPANPSGYMGPGSPGAGAGTDSMQSPATRPAMNPQKAMLMQALMQKMQSQVPQRPRIG